MKTALIDHKLFGQSPIKIWTALGFGRKAKIAGAARSLLQKRPSFYFCATKKMRSDVSVGASSVKSAVISSTVNPASVNHC